MSSNVGFLLSGILCLFTVAMLSAVLADGRSMFMSENGRAAVGASYDYRGYWWGDSGNMFNSCSDYRRRFRLLEGATYISLVAAGLGVICSLLGTGSPSKIWEMLAIAVNAVLFVFALIAMAVGWALWSEDYDCTDADFKIKNEYDVNYGPIFLVVGFVFGLANVIILVVFGILMKGTPTTQTEVKADHEPVTGNAEEQTA
ncbi:hypothetical protein DIPPA_20080 [Diplonema papillatum]|nr:hypothetical protein DIPPA_20080 [Diplonema papillatum]